MDKNHATDGLRAQESHPGKLEQLVRVMWPGRTLEEMEDVLAAMRYLLTHRQGDAAVLDTDVPEGFVESDDPGGVYSKEC